MALDPQYLDAIKGFEGYTPNASWDYKQYSSGYGTKAAPGEVIDQAEAEKRFGTAIDQAAAHVDSVNPNLPPGVRAALTSLTYNAGPGWAQSGLGEAIKSGNLEKAREIFPQYNKAGGEVNPGLVARRGKELAWWGGQPQPPQASPAAPANGLLQPQVGGLQPGMPGGLAPIFPQAQQAQPQARTQQDQADIFSQMQMPQAPPIFYAPRRSPDLSQLKMVFKAPVFRRG